MSPNEIVNFWGWDNLKRWPEMELRDIAIPQSSKQFLVEVGLPCNEDWTLRFGPETDHLSRPPNKDACWCIGFDDFVPICLDEKRGGCVVTIEVNSGTSERLVNSSVERFAEFLVLYQEYRKAARALPEEEVVKTIPIIEEKMRRIDPVAFGDPNNYWSVVIDQINQGLL